MSKTALKKELQFLSKERLIEQILELYDTYKPVKEYYKIYLNPQGETELLEKYKAIVVNEFFPKSNRIGRSRFSVAKKAISDFKTLHPSAELLADLMVTLPEMACKFLDCHGDASDQFYSSAANNFEAALKFLKKEKLLDKFQSNCENCVKYSKGASYGGFEDEINDIFDEYYPKK
jgi:hypothetical protein